MALSRNRIGSCSGRQFVFFFFFFTNSSFVCRIVFVCNHWFILVSGKINEFMKFDHSLQTKSHFFGVKLAEMSKVSAKALLKFNA